MTQLRILTQTQQFGWKTAYFGGAVAALAYFEEFPLTSLFEEQFGLVSAVNHLPAFPQYNRILFLDFGDIVYVGIEGTSRLTQWANYLHNFGLVQPGVDEGYPAFFKQCADLVVLAIQARVPANKPIVLCGHSLGGATASIASQWLRTAGWNIRSVWTYGSPRPANRIFADRYDITNFRMFSDSDVVPRVPLEGQYYLVTGDSVPERARVQTMMHVGTPIQVGELDLEEARFSSLKDLKDISFYRGQTTMNSHFMGSYNEAMWGNLSPGERRDMRPLFEALQPLGSQGTPNFAFEIAPGDAQPALRNEADVTERSLADSLVGDEGTLKIELFTGPVPVPDDPGPFTFQRPTFAGYAAQTIPSDVARRRTDDDTLSLDSVAVRFTLAANLVNPVFVIGVFVTASLPDGSFRVIDWKTFSQARGLTHKGDYVAVRIGLDIARVQ